MSSSGARPSRSPCTDAVLPRTRRGVTASGLRRNAPTIEPADVPTTRSADLASYPRSASARSTPRWKASPVRPPAPRTRPTLLTTGWFPDSSVVMPGAGDAGGIDELTDDASRVAGDQGVVRNVLADHRAGGDETALPDGHARQDDGSRADPRRRRRCRIGASFTGRPSTPWLSLSMTIGLVGDRDVVADRDLEDAHEDDTAVDEDAVADADAAPAGDERLAIAGPDLEVVADLEVGGVDRRVAQDGRLCPDSLRPPQPDRRCPAGGRRPTTSALRGRVSRRRAELRTRGARGSEDRRGGGPWMRSHC